MAELRTTTITEAMSDRPAGIPVTVAAALRRCAFVRQRLLSRTAAGLSRSAARAAAVVHHSLYVSVPATALLASAMLATPTAARAGDRDLADLSIEELMNIEVTSVSKRAQKLSETAAAVFVITHDEIARSGARNVPEALRLAPGVDVAALGGGRYSVSIRGFNSRFSAKLLVLIDGRSVYTPSFSGVLWETIRPPLENIDRIEVIRGPGAAIWGANAVNGVINIIMKSSQDTQGAYVKVGGGTRDKAFADVSYGGRLSAHTTYRVYGDTEKQGESETPDGDPANDRAHTSRAGVRLDMVKDSDRLSLQGEGFNLTTGDRVTEPTLQPPYAVSQDVEQHNSGGHVLGRWDRTISATQNVSLQAYYDFLTLTWPLVAGLQQKAYDLEFEHRIEIGGWNDVTWGLSYRQVSSRASAGDLLAISDTSPAMHLSGGFFQDEIAIVPDALRLTLGAKLEHETYSGMHFMPNARLLWDVTSSTEAWLAVSQAVRTPSQMERYASVAIGPVQLTPVPLLPPPAPPFELPVLPVEDLSSIGSERLTAYEAGYRTELTRDLSLDATAYFNRYRDLRTASFGAPVPLLSNGIPYGFILPIQGTNTLAAQELGFEIAANWSPCDWWRLQGSYSRVRIKLEGEDIEGSLASTPRGIASLRSTMDIASTRFDLWLRHVAAREATSYSARIPEYTTMDVALSWPLVHGVRLSVVGKDLLAQRHLEAVSTYVTSQPVAVNRSVLGSLTFRY
jgi:iron complex outermembrane receptor protein